MDGQAANAANSPDDVLFEIIEEEPPKEGSGFNIGTDLVRCAEAGHVDVVPILKPVHDPVDQAGVKRAFLDREPQEVGDS